jgi:hypothetical protein
MDYLAGLAPLGLIGIFLGNELMLALAINSYGMAYIPMRVVVIPACAGTLIVTSVVRGWSAYHRDRKRSRQVWEHVASAVLGGAIWAFQWCVSSPLFMR